jgi:hypothetical protein
MVNPRFLVLALILSVAAPTASAQRLAAPFMPWASSIAGAQPRGVPVLKGESRDYRVEGAVVGTLFLGALGYWFGHEVCTHQPQPAGPNGRDCGSDGLVVGFVAGVVGAGVGYVVGRSKKR